MKSKTMPLQLIFIILANAIFFSGYVIYKFPLATFLVKLGLTANHAYALTTSAVILFALCSLSYGIFFQRYVDPFLSALLSQALLALGFVFFEFASLEGILLSISCYVVGGSLYFYSVTMLINSLSKNAKDRLSANQVNHILLNLGTVLGVVICIAYMDSLSTIFVYGAISLVLSFIIMFFLYVQSHAKTRLKSGLILLLICTGLMLCVDVVLRYGSPLRLVSIVVYLLMLATFLIRSSIDLKKAIITILLFSFPYWIANVIMYNQVFYFLSVEVSSHIHHAIAYIVLLDPLGNVLFGSWFRKYGRDNQGNEKWQLVIGMACLLVAFSLLAVSSFLYLYPVMLWLVMIMAILIFSSAQFLIQTQMNH